jgi:hypothetical protein
MSEVLLYHPESGSAFYASRADADRALEAEPLLVEVHAADEIYSHAVSIADKEKQMSGNVDWNTGEYEARAGFETLPKGRYLAVVDNTKMTPTKDRSGKYIEVDFVVVRPESAKNRKLWARLNVHNASAEAQRIGREQFNALALACGVDAPKDSSQLHNKVVVLIVDIEPANGQYKEKNIVTGYLKPSENDSKVERPKREERPAQRPAPEKKPAGKFDDMEDDFPF